MHAHKMFRNSNSQILLTIIFHILLFGPLGSTSLPLSTHGRWIIDSKSGARVKLHCVNWASHMQASLAEGLDRQPLRGIVSRISKLRFNCVRFTWSTDMFTKPSYTNLTVGESLGSLGLTVAQAGLLKKNPSMWNMTVHQAFDVVVDELGAQGIMVIVDNHVSKPQWCCGDDDGNGFFGDKDFDPGKWVEGLHNVATRFKGKPQVVGMSLRNELRGPRQNKDMWYKYVRQGASVIHKTNPNVLVIVSGISYDSDLSFLREEPLGSNFDNKLVYEGHWYAFTNGDKHNWVVQPPSEVCSRTTKHFDEKIGFVIQGENPVPLFISEFGLDQRGVDVAGNRYISCLLAYAAEKDLDWAIWALQGDYYIRNGTSMFVETYGVLDSNWDKPQNPNFVERYKLIEETLQEPKSNASTSLIMYHPLSGLCTLVDDKNGIRLSNCQDRSLWSYSGDGTTIKLVGTSMCLKVVGDGLPVTLSTDCSSNQSKWRMVSSSMLHLAAVDEHRRLLCLENPSNSSTMLSKECLCLKDTDECVENPEIQWFKLVPTNMG